MSKRIESHIQHLHQKFQCYGRNAREWMRKCIMMLPEIERERVWEKKGFGSLSEYAARLAGMSHKTVIDGLRIMQVVQHMPDIVQVIEKRGIAIVRPVLTLLTSDNQKFWAEKMSMMSQHTLEMYIHELRSQRHAAQQYGQHVDPRAHDNLSIILPEKSTPTLDIFGERALSEEGNFPQQEAISIVGTRVEHQTRTVVAMELDSAIASQLQKLKGQDGDWNELMQEFLDLRTAHLEVQKPEPVETTSRHIPNKIQRHVIARTNGTCSFTDCTKPANTLHHTQRFALEQIHDPDRIEPLCTAHERIVHNGLIEDESIPANEWQVRAEPDQDNAKYLIDQQVQKYRKPE